MIKRMMLWAAMAAMTGGAMAVAPATDGPFPPRGGNRLTAMKSMPMPASLGKALLADITESFHATASDPAEQDHFGYSVAIDGDTAVVGAYQKDGTSLIDVGAAYVYVRNGGTWSQQQKLVAGTPIQNAAFGQAVAVSGNTIAVGAPFDDNGQTSAGAVYVFTRSGSVWTELTKLAGAQTSSGDRFGWSLALEGDTLVAGAKTDDVGSVNNGGALYVFTRTAGVWSAQGSRLSASDAQEDDQLGVSVALYADTLVAGAEGVAADSGAAYVFTRSGGVWTQRTRLQAASPAPSNFFGRAVAIDAGTIVVGEFGRTSNTGAAHVFVGSGDSWTFQVELTAADVAGGDAFGHAVAVRGDLALVGAYDEESGSSPANRGAVYAFRRSGGVWTQPDKYLASDASSGDRLGFGVALSPGAAISGAPNDLSGGFAEAGSAYVYQLGTPTTTVQILTPIPTVFGGSLGLNAQVSGGTPTGSVEFRNGASVLATAPLNGSGVAATSIMPNAGSYSVVAHYLGDGTHLSSNSTATAFTVAKAPTTLELTSSGSPSSYGQNVTFTATVATTAPGASPVTGIVEFRDGVALLATVPLSGGVASHVTNALLHNTGSAHPITATFIENTNYFGSTDDAINHVVDKATPTLMLVSNPNPSLFGQSVLITATVSGGLAPTGVVMLSDDGTPFAGPTLSGGVVTHNISTLALGTNNLTAFYNGDANHNAVNIAAPTVHTVLPSADVSVTKSNGTNFVQSGQTTTYSIVVSNPGGGADVDGLLVNDVLDPADFDVGAATWSCAPAGICSPDSGTGDIVNLPLDLPAGSTVTITVIVPVLLAAEDGIANSVTLTLPGTVGDPNLANNSATDTDGSGLFKDSFED